MKNFAHFTRQEKVLRDSMWKIEISPEVVNNKHLNDFIDCISVAGIRNLSPVVSKQYRLVALLVNIEKSIKIYSLKEWELYN